MLSYGLRDWSVFVIFILIHFVDSFKPSSLPIRLPTRIGVSLAPYTIQPTFTVPDEQDGKTYLVNKETAGAIIKIGKGNQEKIVNIFGLWCAFVATITGPIWMIAMFLVGKMSQIMVDWDPHKSLYDTTGKLWSKVWLVCINCYPTVSGNIQQLKEREGACLYVANHASFMDIPVLCTVLEKVFKFIAKGELRKVPCIGQQLQGVSSKRIFVVRTSRSLRDFTL